jgi:hypothetical protein
MSRNYTEQEKADARKLMRKYLFKVRRGTAITYATVKHVSASGMSRIIAYTGFYVENGRIREVNITYYMDVLGVANLTPAGKPYGVRVGGCGMDMIFNTLYNLHHTVFTKKDKIHYSSTTRYNYM